MSKRLNVIAGKFNAFVNLASITVKGLHVPLDVIQYMAPPHPLNTFTSITPRESGFQMVGGQENGRAFMGHLRRVRKAQRRRKHLRSLRGKG